MKIRKRRESLHLKIADDVKRTIVRGDIVCGAKLMSVRQYAKTIGVSPGTAAKVYAELEREGLINCRGAKGTFATKDRCQIGRLRRRLIRGYAERFVKEIKEPGVSMEEGVKILTKVRAELDRKRPQE